MPIAKSMTRLELIRIIGDVITEVDVLRSNFKRQTKSRKSLDNIRDELDTSQRKLVRNVIKDNTKQFIELTKSLKEVNEGLRQTIEDVDQVAQTLETLVKFVSVVQKIAELMP
jgi:DNA anti-recombination protein RmuC